MDSATTRQKILESDDFVLSETKRIQYLYGLKHETRYDLPRDESIATESVADHVYALQLLADYFLPLEDPGHELDWNKVKDMLLYHDISEIETGDQISYRKTAADRAREHAALPVVFNNLPQHIRPKVVRVVEEYEAQQSAEAVLSNAIDKIEPIFQLYCDNGRKIIATNCATIEQFSGKKGPATAPYQSIHRFYHVLKAQMEKEGFFAHE